MSTASRVWTYADLERMPESQDGRRYEIIAGELIATPSPTPPHQLVAYRLSRWVGDHVDRHGLGQLSFAPVDVVLGDETLVPDLLFVRRDRLGIVGPKAIVGGPDLVLEILSPSTRDRDLGEKKRLYARHGVREYWIVDPRSKQVAVFGLHGDRYAERPIVDGLAGSEVVPGFALDVAALFAGL